MQRICAVRAGEGRAMTPAEPSPPRFGRRTLVTRLWRTAERQVADIETRLIEAGGDPATLERDAKTLAVLARTVRDLVAIDAEQKRGAKADRNDDEKEAPRDFDQFRTELSETLHRLAEQRRS